MSVPKSYETVTEAVNDLQKRGYTTNFSLWTEKECLICNQPSLSLSPEDFEIDELYRFEGMTDPGDEMIVMAISSEKYQVKGVVVNGFGMYSDGITAKITKLLTK
ncbi:MAG: phosphoribosylpyrophosphate synthetase [Flavobacteriaceae bacterium CG_4_8_14_3_um_filter_34_10]|nr:phosphoribosylpyrophosphate synthetase [Flavobacteriia bacterium]OIP51423.1 MAG: phosphoribosylpyrophosphate synthetase [Flavobacteriaceae bacterium CG2_30_34_30]PIQ17903.1 MAG: phosphoribosylpyrophosphate synthetase [Flavobacteriaceae bacterium CG18_big_fil_WC_8_21_14_2_50_34_36]PIV51815.1 MAG: phosphoribosylpyrophosphate synthetase [Flavobacteriaceae bacterium CG02_land_8_20_14_3_00_34_13]PIX09630.1 MAG: phosphoribosylpyrophosphate synthetase [Flavobacteriaceae bacterium CG_4_8_14_3_um_fil